MGWFEKREELIRDTVDAYEQSTGQSPNDYEFGTIKAVVESYMIDEANEELRKKQ